MQANGWPQNSNMPRVGMFPAYSGVDQLILAAQLDATQNMMSNYATSGAMSSTSNYNFLPPLLPPLPPPPYLHGQLANQPSNTSQQVPTMPTAATSADGRAHLQPSGQPEARQVAPKNQQERELYELLRKANLLEYFAKFIKFGGDDVQQLADADELEFVEIMELVEMNHKPLHMRRMQKALDKWRQDKGDALDACEENFRRPEPVFYESGCPLNVSIRSESSLAESLAPTSTGGASRSLFPTGNETSDKFSSSSRNNSILESPQKQYCTPHVVIKNAPKKPRLMDSIVPSDLTKGIRPLGDAGGPLGSTPKRDSLHDYLKRSSARVPVADDFSDDGAETQNPAEYSPPESPASLATSDSDVIEVGLPDKRPTGTSKRKRTLKKPAAANLRKYYGISTVQQQRRQPQPKSQVEADKELTASALAVGPATGPQEQPADK